MLFSLVRIALFIAITGTISSWIVLILALLGASKFRRDSVRQKRQAENLATLPPVSVLKPVHGHEAALKQNVESFFRQDYSEYEILFAADDKDDPAVEIISEICARHPEVKSRILITGRSPWPNPPAYSFYRMAEAADHEILVTSDSDVEVTPSYLREVVSPLTATSTGMVTCLYRGKNRGSLWSALDAVGMSVEMTAGVLTANLLEGMKFGLGPTIAIRKDSLAKIGGYRSLGDYFSNDFMIGNMVEKAGYRVGLSRHVIDHVVPLMNVRQMWERQVRWAKGTRYSRPKGHAGTIFVFAMPYGILGLVAGGVLHHALLGLLLFALAILNRLIEGYAIGWGVVRDPEVRRAPWLNPLRDVLGFFVWCASYMGKKAMWRDSRYELIEGGRIILRQPSTE